MSFFRSTLLPAAIVLLFGLGMAVVTVLWSAADTWGDAAADAVDLR